MLQVSLDFTSLIRKPVSRWCYPSWHEPLLWQTINNQISAAFQGRLASAKAFPQKYPGLEMTGFTMTEQGRSSVSKEALVEICPTFTKKFTFNCYLQFVWQPHPAVKNDSKSHFLSETALSDGHVIRLKWSRKATTMKRAVLITHLDYEFF